MATEAERLLEDAGWLPEPMRTPEGLDAPAGDPAAQTEDAGLPVLLEDHAQRVDLGGEGLAVAARYPGGVVSATPSTLSSGFRNHELIRQVPAEESTRVQWLHGDDGSAHWPHSVSGIGSTLHGQRLRYSSSARKRSRCRCPAKPCFGAAVLCALKPQATRVRHSAGATERRGMPSTALSATGVQKNIAERPARAPRANEDRNDGGCSDCLNCWALAIVLNCDIDGSPITSDRKARVRALDEAQSVRSRAQAALHRQQSADFAALDGPHLLGERRDGLSLYPAPSP